MSKTKRVAIDNTKLLKHGPTGGKGESPAQPTLIKHSATGSGANKPQPKLMSQTPENVSKIGERQLRHPMDSKGQG